MRSGSGSLSFIISCPPPHYISLTLLMMMHFRHEDVFQAVKEEEEEKGSPQSFSVFYAPQSNHFFPPSPCFNQQHGEDRNESGVN